MIKANDLRLGNIVQRPEHLRIDMLDGGDIYFRVNSTMIRDCEHYKEDWAFEPVKLTPDIMVKAGYDDFRLDTIVPFEFADATHCAWFDKDVLVLCPFCTNDKDLFIQLQFVHKLQNLHYALTGTELSITL